jgi:hypothetical protein
VHDGRLPFLQTLLQFASPNAYAQHVLAGYRYAWGKGLAYEDALFVPDPAAASLLTAEWQNGIRTEWPPTFSEWHSCSVQLYSAGTLQQRMAACIWM